MNKVRFALVGCGRIGERHAKHINEFGILVAVCDIVEEKARAVAEQYGADVYGNIDDLLLRAKNVDVVSICTPNGLHAVHSIKALKANFHVLCEKPMAISVQDCGEMIKVAERMNRRLFVIKQNRFNPPVVAVKELLDNNGLGRIFNVQLTCYWNRNEDYYRNSWKGTKDMDGGTLYTQFSHFIDLLYWFFGDVKKVASYTKNFAHEGIIEFEDSGVVILEFYSGTIGTINYSVNSYLKNMEGSLTILGEKGAVKIGGQYINTLEYQCISNREILVTDGGNQPNNYGSYVGSMSNHDKTYQNVIDVIQNSAPISTNFFEGLKTVEIIDRIYNSANQ